MEHPLRRKTTSTLECQVSYTLTATTLKKTSSKERAMMHRSKDMHKAVVMSIEINATITGIPFIVLL